MKKSLLALAVLGAFAGVAQAQTNVTLYGLVDVGIQYNDNDADEGDNWSLNSGNQSPSRFGIRGTEDLGGGLQASFVLEQGFNVDTGNFADTNRQFQRLAYVGLNGGFGGVRLGRQVTPTKAAVDAIDPFGGSGQGQYYNYAGRLSTGGTINDRVDNAVTYITPNVAGFTGQVQYAFGESRGAFATGRQWGAQVGYGNGPLNVQVAYANEHSPVAFGTIGTGPTAISSVGVDEDSFFVGATYDFGVVKAHASAQQQKFDDGEDDLKLRTYLLGVTVPFGASAFVADWVRNDVKDIDDAQSDAINLMYTYALSKRTNVYTIYSHVRNDDASRTGIGAPAFGDTSKTLSVGVRHTF